MARTAKKKEISDDQRRLADDQIKEQQSETKYTIRDFTIGYLVEEFRQNLFFIPPYQREFVWPAQHSSNFVESVILGLPIPMMFVAEIEDGTLEIVDGAQRLTTLERFLNDDLVLKNLKYLSALEGFKYSDLSDAQQRKFNTKPLRLVVLEESTSLERRQEFFNRINTGSVKARPSEIRRGNFDNPFMQFVIELSTDPTFVKLCPQSKARVDRREREELVLRFFAYLDRYQKFRHDVYRFLDQYLEDMSPGFERDRMKNEFDRMLEFVSKHFPAGFAKTKNAKSTPRVRFEALSVGVALALREDPDADPKKINWMESDEFLSHTTTHASNSGPKLRRRVEYVRDQILGDKNA